MSLQKVYRYSNIIMTKVATIKGCIMNIQSKVYFLNLLISVVLRTKTLPTIARLIGLEIRRKTR